MKNVRKTYTIQWKAIVENDLAHLPSDAWIVLEYIRTWIFFTIRKRPELIHREGDKVFAWIHYDTMKKDLPQLPKTRQGLRKFFDKMINHKLLETTCLNGNRIFFTLTDLGWEIVGETCPELEEKPAESEQEPGNKSFPGEETKVSPGWKQEFPGGGNKSFPVYNNKVLSIVPRKDVPRKDRENESENNSDSAPPCLSDFPFLPKKFSQEELEAIVGCGHRLLGWIDRKGNGICKMEKQLNLPQAVKLCWDYNKGELNEVLTDMANTKKTKKGALHVAYVDVNATIRSWLRIRGILPRDQRKPEYT